MLTKRQEEFYDWTFYQIYPRSFMDSNGDGIGDLNGITQKLDYLKELGINAVWLSPCYKSPNDDNGYDISDYNDIMDDFGTMADWKNMINEMHKRGIKLVMDFVANHTSIEHKWFQEARKSKDNPYRDFYYWADEPLNDWQSCFGGGVWEYDEVAGQYYLHTFAKTQADLNWENPKVREEIIKMVDFWVDLGVDGFRCDALDCISKDFENNTNSSGPNFHKYINEVFGREKVKDIFTVGECWTADENNINDLTGGERGELSASFIFNHVLIGRTGKYSKVDFTMDDIRDELVKWQNLMQKNELLYPLFWENHDLPRCTTRYGNDREKRYENATMLASMMFLQKGIPFIYQGGEIGTANYNGKKIEEFRDIEAINYYNEFISTQTNEQIMADLNYASRDTARHPMSWNANSDAGFGSENPWAPFYDRYKEINVETDRSTEKSVFTFYQALLKIRKDSNAIRHGVYEDITNGRKGCYIYKRYDENETYYIICNFENEQSIELDFDCEIVLSNSNRKEISGTYAPYECAIVRK